MRLLGAALLLLSGASHATAQEAGTGLGDLFSVTNRQSFNPLAVADPCSTPAGEAGRCVAFNGCPGYFSLVPQLKNPRIFQFLSERICSISSNAIYICCPNGQPILPTEFALNPVPVAPESELPSIIPSDIECGIAGGERIIKGTTIQPGTYPWLAALGIRRNNQFFSLCGGSLFTRKHVLTAAHCFTGSGIHANLVRLGEHHLNNDVAGERPEEFNIARQISNNYNTVTQEDDISILILDREVGFNDFIRPICLPFNFKRNELTGQEVTVVGWGATQFGVRNTDSQVPLEASIRVLSRNECVRNYNTLATAPVIDGRQLCAAHDGKDSCSGDSGGPLNYFDRQSERHVLVGIVSFGVGCGLDDYPGIYTRVSSFLDWILQNVQ